MAIDEKHLFEQNNEDMDTESEREVKRNPVTAARHFHDRPNVFPNFFEIYFQTPR